MMNIKTWAALTALALCSAPALCKNVTPEKKAAESTPTAQTTALAASTAKNNAAKQPTVPQKTTSDSLYLKLLFNSPTLETLIEQTESVDTTFHPSATVPDSVIKRRLELLDQVTPFDLRYNPEVRTYINMYLDRRRELIGRLVGLSQYYYGMFEETLEKYSVPLEIRHLVVIESAMNPLARSHVGASGLWQFMLGTGKMYGLRVDSYVDERFDPRRSTEAAARYLSDLYKMYGDWNLALAAYNSGPGTVNKAIIRSGGRRDYWTLRAYLPRETQSYVVAFIAANYVMNYYKEHGIIPDSPQISYYNTDTVRVKRMIDFKMISDKLNVPLDELRFFNPSYKLGVVPKVENRESYVVLPMELSHRFVEMEDQIYAEAKAREDSLQKKMTEAVKIAAQTTTHTVRRGETLGGIAARYRVSVTQLKTWNRLKSSMIRIGQKLIVKK